MDEKYIRRCLNLANFGKGTVSPNPLVGAVLVHNQEIIGEGYHVRYGEAHAEVNCINSVSEENKWRIEKSTLYVSLEPCAHFGKTPPCSQLITKMKIPKVVIGCRDPFEKVAGKGIDHLKENGVEVVEGVLEKECININQRFFTFHRKKRPYIILKWAESQDGFIGKKEDRILISNWLTNREVHRWRSEEDAILVGARTAALDNPQLTARLWPGKNPVRVLIDPQLAVNKESKIYDGTASTIVFNYLKNGIEPNVEFVLIDGDHTLKNILQKLYERNIQSLIIEGGAFTLQQWIDENFWDECRLITNTHLKLGEGIAAPVLSRSHLVFEKHFEDDCIQTFKNNSDDLLSGK